jgi:ABC-2 type transport system permease protein
VSTFPVGTFTPSPGPGRPLTMLHVHARTEFLVTVRHPEQLLLTLLIPMALLVGLSVIDLLDVPAGLERVDTVAPRVFALAVMSAAFTGQAIALGFDRRYGVLKRLAATALPRWVLVCGRLAGLLGVVAAQLVLLGAVALAMGWHPTAAGLAWALPTVLLGTLAFGALGVLLGGTLRAEIVLALANALWFVLLLAGGIVLSPSQLPAALGEVVRLLPSGALAEGLHDTLAHGQAPGWGPLVVLAAWAAGAAAVAVRTVRLT